MASIKEVARYAGVAVSTVSKVLNNYPGVSDSTKEKVNKAVQELHFVPNAAAARLSSKQLDRIALIVRLPEHPGATDEINMQYLTGAMHAALDYELDVITIFYNMIEHQSLGEVTAYLKSQNITGIIIFGMNKEDTLLLELVEAGPFRIVLVDAPYVNQWTSSISIDQETAQYEIAAKTITENDCKSILYITGKQNDYATSERENGIKKYAKQNHVPLKIVNGNGSELKARLLTMEHGADKDVIVCASDLMAIGAMRALMYMDIFHPVCGFGGINLMAYAGKQMNTVRVNYAMVAKCAVQELKALLNGKNGEKIVLEYELVNVRYEDEII